MAQKLRHSRAALAQQGGGKGAALANGVANHAMDYDFTFLNGQSVAAARSATTSVEKAGANRLPGANGRFLASFLQGYIDDSMPRHGPHVKGGTCKKAGN